LKEWIYIFVGGERMDFIFEQAAQFSVEETLDRVKKSLKSNGFGTLFQLNFKDKFAEHDMVFDSDFYVLEVCNPGFAKQILDISIDVGYFLPCKVVVYEKDGQARVGMAKPTAMLPMVLDDDKAGAIAQEVETIILNSIKEAL